MFIISLYHTDLIFLTHKLIGKIKSIILKNSERLALERRFRHGLIFGGRPPKWFEPLLPDALLCRIAQISRFFKQGHRFADRNVACVRQLLGKTFLGGKHQRLADPPRPWAQTYHGLYGRGSCPQSHRTGQAEREQSQGSLAESHGQGSERPYVQAFLSALAQDISE